MMSRVLGAITATCLLLMSSASVAQTSPNDVTIQIPLNLTKIASDITKVAVECGVIPPTGSNDKMPRKKEEFPISGDQLVKTVTIVVTVTDSQYMSVADLPGKTLGVGCQLTGFSGTLQRWDYFAEAHPVEVFRLSPTPQPISGSFVW